MAKKQDINKALEKTRLFNERSFLTRKTFFDTFKIPQIHSKSQK